MNKPIETFTDTANNAFNYGIDAASGTMHKAIDSAHGAVNKMANGANHAADAIAAKGVQLQHMQRQLTHSAKTQARTHPLLTLGIVLAGGALLSYWFSRRNNGNDAG